MQSHWSPSALLAVGVGGAVGSIGRYVIGSIVQRVGTAFPWGTLSVNVTGSFLLGALITWLVARSATPEARLFLTIGLCGGYTTFSTFAYESALMLEDGRVVRAALYVGSSALLTIGAMFLGFATARSVLH